MFLARVGLSCKSHFGKYFSSVPNPCHLECAVGTPAQIASTRKALISRRASLCSPCRSDQSFRLRVPKEHTPPTRTDSATRDSSHVLAIRTRGEPRAYAPLPPVTLLSLVSSQETLRAHFRERLRPGAKADKSGDAAVRPH